MSLVRARCMPIACPLRARYCALGVFPHAGDREIGRDGRDAGKLDWLSAPTPTWPASCRSHRTRLERPALIPTDPSNGTIVPLIPTTGIGTGFVKPSSFWRFPAFPTVPAQIVKLKDVTLHGVDWNPLAVDTMTALKPIFFAWKQQASAAKFLCYGRAIPVTTGLLETSWCVRLQTNGTDLAFS